MAGDPHFLKDNLKALTIVSSINSQKIRKFCVWEIMIAIVFNTVKVGLSSNGSVYGRLQVFFFFSIRPTFALQNSSLTLVTMMQWKFFKNQRSLKWWNQGSAEI